MKLFQNSGTFALNRVHIPVKVPDFRNIQMTLRLIILILYNWTGCIVTVHSSSLAGGCQPSTSKSSPLVRPVLDELLVRIPSPTILVVVSFTHHFYWWWIRGPVAAEFMNLTYVSIVALAQLFTVWDPEIMGSSPVCHRPLCVWARYFTYPASVWQLWL